jgi:uncharacterized protein (DUF302 family)
MEKSSYSIDKVVNLSHKEAVEKVSEELKKEGFGVLSDLNFTEILKNKLDVDFKPYRVLAACNPPSAYKALQAEEQIGLFLPCNVIIYVNDSGETVVAAIDPIANMSGIDNLHVQEVAALIHGKLKNVIENM